ncbi:MAG: hypothetical protein WCR06_06370 [bacterium]
MKNMRLLVPALVACMGVMLGCVSSGRKQPAQTQFQIREFQTRTYETKDATSALKAVLNVLQDEGFIIKSADSNLGYLTGSKEVDVADSGEAVGKTVLMTALFGLPGALSASWKKNALIEATANVSLFGDQTRVRVNFQRKTLDNRGNPVDVEQIDDAVFYKNFFAKVDKGIFIAKENL